MTQEEKFDIILSKNRIARKMKRLYEETEERVPSVVLFDFDEIEKATGTSNQPTGREILTTKMDI